MRNNCEAIGRGREPDLEYSSDGLFTTFLPNTHAGEQAWRELAAQTEGTGKVFQHHTESTVEQLRKAGYTVAKTKRSSRQLTADDYKLLDELGAAA